MEFFSGAPNAIAQTTDGYLWIGTQAGLMRFDGVVVFVSWQPPEGKEITVIPHQFSARRRGMEVCGLEPVWG